MTIAVGLGHKESNQNPTTRLSMKCQLNNERDQYFALKLLDGVFILLINVKMPTVVGILN